MTKVLYIGNILSKHGKTPTNIETLGPLLEVEGYEFVYASDKKNILIRMLHMIWIALTTSGLNYVMIDTYSTLNFYSSYVIGRICQFRKVKYIPILHGGDLPNRLKSSLKLCSNYFSKSYHNIAPSGYLKYEFEQCGYETLYIPNNIDLASYQFLERKEYQPRLLFVRSFHEIYNTPMAINVIAKVLKKYPQAELCMVGPDKDGSLAVCQNLAKELGVENNVKFMGRMSKQEWHQLSVEYSIFISTTNFDNTPVSVIEAMALGLPVISTSVGGVPYLVDDGNSGFLVEKGNVEEMVSKIDYIINNQKEVFDIAVNARKQVESYDWEVVKKQWSEILL